MASQHPRLSFTPRGHPFPHPMAVHSNFPYHLGANAASSPFIQQVDSMSLHEASRFRIATLEDELAQALSEKAAAEHATQYILKASAAQWQDLGQRAENVGDPKLEGEIRSLTTEVTDLRKRLLELTGLLEKTLQSRDKTTADKELSSDPSTIPNKADISQQVIQSVDNPVHLLDLGEDESLELCQPPSSEDGLDDLALFCQYPPKIDFGSGEKKVGQVSAASDDHESRPQIDSPIVRRFLPSSTETSCLSESVGQSSVAKQSVTETSTPTSSFQSSSPKFRHSKADTCMNRILAGRVYPTASMAHPERPVPPVADPRAQSWKAFSRESSAAYAKADELCADDFLKDSAVVKDFEKSNHGKTMVLRETDGPSCIENANTLPKFSKKCTLEEIYTNASEFHHACAIHQRSTRAGEPRFPDFFRYGIRFQPSPATPNTFQTLSFMNLHPKIVMAELMDKVRGGIVISCQLFDTTGITGSLSARVRFLQESEALAYDDFAAANAITFHGRRARVSVVQTPSFPLSPRLIADILKGGRTRCLEVHNFPRRIAQYHLLHDLRILGTQTTGIERMQMHKGRVLDLRFSSIWHAERAYAKLVSYRNYRSCRIVWTKDPCALPLNTLKEEATMPGRCDIAVGEAKCGVENHVMRVTDNDNKVAGIQHLPHHNSEISAIPHDSFIKSSAQPFFSPNSLPLHLPTIQTSLNQQPSTVRNTSLEHTDNTFFSSTLTAPDSDRVGKLEPKMNSSKSTANQLSSSMWAPSSIVDTAANHSMTMCTELNDKTVTTSVCAPEMFATLVGNFIEESHDLEPLTKSIWAPYECQVESPAAKFTTNIYTESSKSELSSAGSASSQTSEPAEQTFSSGSTESSNTTVNSFIANSHHVSCSAAEFSCTSGSSGLNTPADQDDATNISGDPETYKCSLAFKHHLIELGIFKADAIATYSFIAGSAPVNTPAEEECTSDISHVIYSSDFSTSFLEHLKNLGIYKEPGYSYISPGSDSNGFFDGQYYTKWSATMEEHLVNVGIDLENGNSVLCSFPHADMGVAGDVPTISTKGLASTYFPLKPAMGILEMMEFAVELSNMVDEPALEIPANVLALVNVLEVFVSAATGMAKDFLNFYDNEDRNIRSLAHITPLTPTKVTKPATKRVSSEQIQKTAEKVIASIEDHTSCSDELESELSHITPLTPTKRVSTAPVEDDVSTFSGNITAADLKLIDDTINDSTAPIKVIKPDYLKSKRVLKVDHTDSTPSKQSTNIMDMDIEELSLSSHSPSSSFSESATSSWSTVATSPTTADTSPIVTFTTRTYTYTYPDAELYEATDEEEDFADENIMDTSADTATTAAQVTDYGYDDAELDDATDVAESEDEHVDANAMDTSDDTTALYVQVVREMTVEEYASGMRF